MTSDRQQPPVQPSVSPCNQKMQLVFGSVKTLLWRKKLLESETSSQKSIMNAMNSTAKDRFP